MNPEGGRTPDAVDPSWLPRIFLREPGWRLGLKIGSEREFCYQLLPGQDYYHRIVDGEVFVYHSDERLCIPCAARRGLLTFEPRFLRPPVTGAVVEGPGEDDGYEIQS